mgnify:FL=1
MNSILKWFGGKSFLLRYILPLPQHSFYAEIFGGGASVLFAKPPSYEELYNDLNDQLVNFWIQLKTYRPELEQKIQEIGVLFSRCLFYRYKEITNDPIENAARFFYMNNLSFSGDMNTFVGIGFKHNYNNHRVMWNKLPYLSEVEKRLKHVLIENQDFRQLIPRLDKKGVIMYIDPPYYEGGDIYERGIGGQKWTKNDNEDLLQILTSIQHAKFILSFDQIEGYDSYNIHKLDRRNRADSGSNGHEIKTEYVIRNFDPKTTITHDHYSSRSLSHWNLCTK